MLHLSSNVYWLEWNLISSCRSQLALTRAFSDTVKGHLRHFTVRLAWTKKLYLLFWIPACIHTDRKRLRWHFEVQFCCFTSLSIVPIVGIWRPLQSSSFSGKGCNNGTLSTKLKRYGKKEMCVCRFGDKRKKKALKNKINKWTIRIVFLRPWVLNNSSKKRAESYVVMLPSPQLLLKTWMEAYFGRT